MAIAISLREYLDQQGTHYEVLEHSHSSNSMQTAQTAHVPGDQLAKGVVLVDERGYVVAVIPATHHLDVAMVDRKLNRKLTLAAETDFSDLFSDCEPGAVPPVSQPYGCDVVVDESFDDASDVYLEAGDHTDLIHMDGGEFQRLMSGVRHGRFSHRI